MNFYLNNLSLQQLGSESRQRNKNVANKFKKSAERAMKSVSSSCKLTVEGSEMGFPPAPSLSHRRNSFLHEDRVVWQSTLLSLCLVIFS